MATCNSRGMQLQCTDLSVHCEDNNITWCLKLDNDHGYVPLVINTSRSFPHSWLTTGFVTRLSRRMPLVEQELLTLLENLSSSPVFSGVRVTRSLVLCVCFGDRCLFFCNFSFGCCVVCSSWIYGFWLSLWYPQTLPYLQESWTCLNQLMMTES